MQRDFPFVPVRHLFLVHWSGVPRLVYTLELASLKDAHLSLFLLPTGIPVFARMATTVPRCPQVTATVCWLPVQLIQRVLLNAPALRVLLAP